MNTETEKPKTVALDKEAHLAAKLEAAKAGLPIGRWISNLIKEKIKENSVSK